MRRLYIPIANIVSVLYFAIADLANITTSAGFGLSAMYQFSLQWFVTLFLKTIAEAEKGAAEVAGEDGAPREATFEETITRRAAGGSAAITPVFCCGARVYNIMPQSVPTGRQHRDQIKFL